MLKSDECQLTIRTANEDRKTGSTGAVANTDGTSELNEVTNSHSTTCDKFLLLVNDFIDTVVRMEGGLDVFEDGDGTVSTSSTRNVKFISME